MTRADIVRNIINDDGYYYTKHSVLEIVNVIFDEHEAQMKAKYEEIDKYQMAIDKQSKRAEALKQVSLDKDEEIDRLK